MKIKRIDPLSHPLGQSAGDTALVGHSEKNKQSSDVGRVWVTLWSKALSPHMAKMAADAHGSPEALIPKKAIECLISLQGHTSAGCDAILGTPPFTPKDECAKRSTAASAKAIEKLRSSFEMKLREALVHIATSPSDISTLQLFNSSGLREALPSVSPQTISQAAAVAISDMGAEPETVALWAEATTNLPARHGVHFYKGLAASWQAGAASKRTSSPAAQAAHWDKHLGASEIRKIQTHLQSAEQFHQQHITWPVFHGRWAPPRFVVKEAASKGWPAIHLARMAREVVLKTILQAHRLVPDKALWQLIGAIKRPLFQLSETQPNEFAGFENCLKLCFSTAAYLYQTTHDWLGKSVIQAHLRHMARTAPPDHKRLKNWLLEQTALLETRMDLLKEANTQAIAVMD